MSEEKFISIQHQIRQNQEEVSDFIRDLRNWETSIKSKDEKLRKETDSDSEKIEPPVRNRVREKRMRKKQAKQLKIEVVESDETSQQEQGSKKSSRIKAYDYRAWDKFDVDKACEEVDVEGYSAGSEYETDSDAEKEEFERQRKIHEANEEKDKGNALFKNGCYDDAITCYTRGIEADPSNAILPANRAMALLKLKRYEEAEKDCSVSIHLDYTYVKAYARRGTARIELRKLEEAKRDFQQVLNIEPSNKQAVSEIKRIERKLKEIEEEKERNRIAEEERLQSEEGIVKPIYKPQHLRSKKPLRRIDIEEIGQDTCEVDKKLASKPQERLEAGVQTGNEEEKEIILKSKDRRREETRPEDTHSTDTSSVTASPSPPSMSVPAVPQTSFQLVKDWKQLHKYPSLLYQYFKQISPSTYPSILQQSLDSNLLNGILKLIVDFYIPSNEPVLETLQCLCNVKRFDMNVMFMSAKEKEVVKRIFHYIRERQETDSAEVDKLAKKYGL